MVKKRNFELECSSCGRSSSFGSYSCSACGGILLANIDLSGLKSPEDIFRRENPGIWKYSPVLPDISARITFFEGQTPCIETKSIGEELELNLYVKDEGRNPTGSFKDRTSSILTSVEKELGHRVASTTSSGNAAGSLALYSRLAGLDLVVFMFRPTPEKLTHTSSFDPLICLVRAEAESEVYRLHRRACEKFSWAELTTMSSANPYNVEGYKTISYEIYEDIGLPDAIVTPVGSGTLTIGIWKGFDELLRMGFIDRLPRLIGVQPERVNPISRAFAEAKDRVSPVDDPEETVATGAVTDNPGLSGDETLARVRETDGEMVSVGEERILDYWKSLPAREGIFAEPTGALSLAGLEVALEGGSIKSGEKVVCVNSASGFKDLSSFGSNSRGDRVVEIENNLEDVARLAEEFNLVGESRKNRPQKDE
uniref:Threonine synthase n=1 Tax=uncultured organism TaxID=155900 RepID=M1PPU3_9ZZZZ|nr:threonine synthase [uncultured organism]